MMRMRKIIDYVNKRFLKEKFIRSGSILFASTLILNITGYFFQFAMSRLMGPKDFGEMNSILSLFSIETVPVMVVSMVIVRYVSRFRALQEFGKLHLFFKNSFRNLIIVAAFLSFGIWLTRTWVGDYLQLSSVTPLVVLAFMVFASFIFPVGTGFVQGLQLFGRLGAIFALLGITRLLFGFLLVYWGWAVSGALLASILSYLSVTVLFYKPFRSVISKPVSGDEERHTKDILRFSIPVAFAFLGTIGLVNLDLIMVKHFFDPERAGQYAAAVVLGRSIYYFPGALAMAMYPMVSEAHDLKRDTFGILKRCLFLTGVLSGVGIVIFFMIPNFLVKTLFGGQYPQAASMMTFYSLAMFPLVLTSVLIQFNLALHKYKFLYPLMFFLFLEGVLIQYHHNSIKDILFVINLCEWLLLIVLLIISFSNFRRQHSNP